MAARQWQIGEMADSFFGLAYPSNRSALGRQAYDDRVDLD
jgi:hypothetical protein